MDERYQKLARSGKEVSTAMRPVAIHPAWVIHERKLGTLMRKARSATFENPSAPGPSAGRMPSLIDGDYGDEDKG